MSLGERLVFYNVLCKSGKYVKDVGVLIGNVNGEAPVLAEGETMGLECCSSAAVWVPILTFLPF